MNSEELSLVLHDEYERVRYYSVRIKGGRDSITKKFFEKFKATSHLKEYATTLEYWIGEIGEHHGAKENLFRRERKAKALPPPTETVAILYDGEPQDPVLRLYCIRLSADVVILLSGDEKTADTVQDCPNCYPHFNFANSLATQIESMIRQGHCEISPKRIKHNKNFILTDEYGITSI